MVNKVRAVLSGSFLALALLFAAVAPAAAQDASPLVRMVQWPAYHQPLLNRLRLDLRIARLLEPLNRNAPIEDSSSVHPQNVRVREPRHPTHCRQSSVAFQTGPN